MNKKRWPHGKIKTVRHKALFSLASHEPCKLKRWFTNAEHSPLLTLSPLSDDDHWVIDTDYDNYAVHYSCRQIDSDGTCLDSYSFIFSRHLTGLRPEDQRIVSQKKNDLCLLGKYRRVAHTSESSTLCSSVYAVIY